jgi:hypothetical protein
MRGMGGIVDALSTMLSIIGIELAPWMGPAFIALVAIALSPFLLQNLQTSRARALLKESRVMDGPDREEAERRVLSLVAKRPRALVAVVEEAHRMRRNILARRALVLLRERTGSTPEVARLARLTDPEPLPNSPAELGLMVEKLRKAGLGEKAQRRLKRGLNKWPSDEWLQALAVGPESIAVGSHRSVVSTSPPEVSERPGLRATRADVDEPG